MEPVKIISKDQLLSIYPDENLTEEVITILKKHAENPVSCWKELTGEVLKPDMPPELHHQLFKAVFNQDEKYSDAPPAWFTEPGIQKKTNLNKLIKKWGLSNYDELHRFTVTQKESFWKGMLEELDIPFKKSPEKILDLSDGIKKPGWLSGARFNIAEACFRAPENKTAIIFGKESGEKGKMTYKELHALSSRVANGLKALQFGKGDRASIDMPMTAESVAIYIGIVMAGGAVVSIADSLAPAEVDKRLRIANTKFLFTQDVLLRGKKSLPLYEKLLKIDPVKTIVLPAKEKVSVPLRDGDLTWNTFLSDEATFDSVTCESNDYCNILFSSGTTGDPKAIPWTHTTAVKAATDGFAHQDIQTDDVVCWPTNIGWMMGPWLIFSSLMNKAGMALFYGAPTGREFGKFVEEAGVSVLGVVPSMVKRWKQTDSLKGIDWTKIKLFSSTGESSNPQDYLWLMAQGGYKPVIEYCGGTEIGGGYLTGTMLQDASPAAFSTPALGIDAIILDDHERPCSEGELFLIPPSIGLSHELLNKNHDENYYDNVPEARSQWKSVTGVPIKLQTALESEKPQLRKHGDEFRKLKNGFFRAQGRADDTMNLGGIKTSSVEIERILDALADVHETAAIAVEPAYGGPNELVVYCTLSKAIPAEELKQIFQEEVKTTLNPLFKVSEVVIIDKLPRTASNKIMRRVLRDEYQKR